ncbi:MAG: hypothetical protein ABL907_16565 [Hyphomicrobium sp.]
MAMCLLISPFKRSNGWVECGATGAPLGAEVVHHVVLGGHLHQPFEMTSIIPHWTPVLGAFSMKAFESILSIVSARLLGCIWTSQAEATSSADDDQPLAPTTLWTSLDKPRLPVFSSYTTSRDTI